MGCPDNLFKKYLYTHNKCGNIIHTHNLRTFLRVKKKYNVIAVLEGKFQNVAVIIIIVRLNTEYIWIVHFTCLKFIKPYQFQGPLSSSGVKVGVYI